MKNYLQKQIIKNLKKEVLMSSKKNINVMLFVLSVLLFTSFFSSCEQYRYDSFDIKYLDIKERFYYSDIPIDLKKTGSFDDDGVPLFSYGNAKYYNPVQIAQYVLQLINSYYLTSNNDYLLSSELILKKMINRADLYDGGLYFPYNFDFKLHGFKDKNSKMIAPWYSAMAQGQILSCLSRVYELTNNPVYLDYANKVFKTLGKIKNKGDKKVWVTMIDVDGFLWLEEYPAENPTHALNGKMYAIFGLYDYYIMLIQQKNKLNKKESIKVLRGALTTIKQKIKEYRNLGNISDYCLLHKVKSFKYHKIHIEQLKYLYKITGDVYFNEISYLLEKDKT